MELELESSRCGAQETVPRCAVVGGVSGVGLDEYLCLPCSWLPALL
jgi:hypothetical protein